MSTCLFTSEILSSISTKKEHTILKALGGRIISREVVSNDFNSDTGRNIDFKLADQFKLIMRELAPLLSKELRETKLKLKSNDQERKYYKNIGLVELAKPSEGLDPLSGKTYLVFPNEENFNEYKKNTGNDLSCFEFIGPEDDILYSGMFSITPESHLSVIKCILTTFDAMLAKKKISETDRFTRLPVLSPIRNFIQTEIYQSQPDIKQLSNYFLGINFNCNELKTLLQKFFDIKFSDYDHVMIVTSDSIHKLLIGSWCILGLENHFVKLCDNWQGDSFSMLIVNPIFGNEQPSIRIKQEEIPFSIGQSTCIKAFCFGHDKTLPQKISQLLSTIREHEYYDAVAYVEMHSDKLLINVFREMIKIHKEYHTIKDLAIARINKLFNSDEHEEVKQLTFESLRQWGTININDFESYKMEFIKDYRKAFEYTNTQPLFHPGKLIIKSRIELDTINK